jgi:hypothetical protein
MSDINQSLLEESFDFKPDNFHQKKLVLILVIALSILLIGFSFFYFIKSKMNKPISLEALDQYQQKS